jgi:hypothetical protein
MAIGVLHQSYAQEESDSERDQKKARDAALAMTTAEAGKYAFEIGPEKRVPVLRKEPILRWSNPERGEIHGNVFLWTDGGRPAVVGSLFKWFSPFTHMSHEFHSLSRGELAATYDKMEVWKTDQAGVKFEAVPGAPDVGKSQAERLIQMRQLARQFTAHTIDRERMKLELRLLAQPVYRYTLDTDAKDLIDGALFTFVQGTDPEVWLLLEATEPAEKRSSRWEYALARMNSVEISVDHNAQPIWHRDPMSFAEIYGHKSAYTSFRFDMP